MTDGFHREADSAPATESSASDLVERTALTRSKLKALERLMGDARTILERDPPKPPRVRTPRAQALSARIRELGMLALDNQAIAARLACDPRMVAVVLSRAERKGIVFPRGGAGDALLLHLGAGTRAALMVAADRRGVSPPALAAELIAIGLKRGGR